jgi:tRNA-dependent cyclodipeptide synthase
MIAYRVQVQNSLGWQKHQATTLGVSITSSNWQDKKFEAILSFAAKRFSTIRIDITDAAYRHGFIAEGMPEDLALAHANALGALWLTRHADIIDACPVKPAIVRWAKWYQHPDYENTLRSFHEAYQTNNCLKDAVHEDIMVFSRRRNRPPTQIEYNCSRDFFIEEVAVITLQARELPSLRIYPGDELSSLRAVRQGLIAEVPKGSELEQFGKIRLERRDRTIGTEQRFSVFSGSVANNPHNQ